MRLSRLLSLPLIALAACTSVAPLPTHTTLPTPPGPSSNGNVRYAPATATELPQWQQAVSGASLNAFKLSCRKVAGKPGWGSACQNSAAVNAADEAAVRAFFEQQFDAWKIEDGARDSGLITGYYEPLLQGSRSQSARAPYPLYGIPGDLQTVDIGAADRVRGQVVVRKAGGQRWVVEPGKSTPDAGELLLNLGEFPDGTRLKARVAGGRLMPYYSRAELEAGALANAPVLAWVADATELFFLQVQGSGRIQMDDGSVLRVNAAENNGQPYVSIGKSLIERGELTAGQATMPGIQAWLRAHPEQRLALFNRNPRYIFFRPIAETGGGPLGSLGVPLTNGYSLAVDSRYIPLGAPVLLATSWPKGSAPLTRLMNAQDTGSAIKGAIRADFFWGFGNDSGQLAGSMKQPGRLWILLPKGVRPAAL